MNEEQMKNLEWEEILKTYEDAQKEFENHWLWRELNTTPKEFFAAARSYAAEQGYSPEEWNQMVEDAKQQIETEAQEKQQVKKTVTWKRFNMVRA
ncbi:MAG: hypothetical protein H7A33_01030 [Deltaproteobacteria bacterium]|nr:hypothetical protein [Deltaproteobacteria bacterium]